MFPWYALHVGSCSESLVAAKLADCGVEAYYPFVLAKSKRLYRPEIEKKFFPGYVFARFDLAARTPVIQIPQVVRILGWGSSPAPIPDSEIEAVRTMTQSAFATVAACPFMAAGDPVLIRSGPLQGLEGFVVYTKPGKARVVVSVMMLNQSISAEVDAADLELIKSRGPLLKVAA